MTETRSTLQFGSALVTGATGFLGAHLTTQLADAGVAVTAVVRPSSAPSRIAGLPTNVVIHTARGDGDDLISCFEQARPDVVFHLAARFLGTHTTTDIAGLIEDNVTFTAHVCEAAVAAGCLSLVAAGTAWQNAGSAPGDPTPAPNTLYAASKQAADDVIDFFANMAGLNAVTLKIYDSYGPNDPRRKFLDALRDAVTNGQGLDATPGDQQLHMVHVDDLIDGFVHAGNQLASNKIHGRATYTLPSKQTVTLRQLAETWMSVNDRDMSINWGGRPHREGEVMVPWEGESLPGWTPQIDLEDGLKGH